MLALSRKLAEHNDEIDGQMRAPIATLLIAGVLVGLGTGFAAAQKKGIVTTTRPLSFTGRGSVSPSGSFTPFIVTTRAMIFTGRAFLPMGANTKPLSFTGRHK